MHKEKNVPVGPADALRLSAGFTERDVALLVSVEQLGTLTAEQAARAFFNSSRSAYNRLRFLSQRRFLRRVAADPATIRTAVGRQHDGRSGSKTGTWNPAFALDRNGYHLLTSHHGYRALNWQAQNGGAVTSRFGHTVGVSDIWSYLVAAARATQEADLSPRGQLRYRFKVGFLTERQSMLTAKRALAAARASRVAITAGDTRFNALDCGDLHGEDDTGDGRDARGRSKVLLRPDGALILAIRELDWPGDDNATVGAIQSIDKGGAEGKQSAIEEQGERSYNARWDPSLHSWKQALLPAVPTRVLVPAQEMPGDTIYRSLLLEMETGSNHVGMLEQKVARYNWLARNRKQAWDSAYGRSPRVLLVVQTDDQIEMQARIWRSRYFVQAETAVLLTSLQTLFRVYDIQENDTETEGMGAAKRGRRALVEQTCWLDVMATTGPTWKSLQDALNIGD